MGVVGFPAGQLPGYLIALFPVAVVGAFLQAAGKLPGLGPAAVRMDVLAADQGALHPGVAVFPVAVAGGVAVFIMAVGLHFPQGAAQVPGAVIAVFLMGMYQEIRIAAGQIVILVIAPFCVLMDLGGAGKGGLLPGCQLGIAFRAMGMLRDGAALFQGDGREDQGIGGAKYHQGAKGRDHFLPPLSISPLPEYFLQAQPRLLCHSRSPPSSVFPGPPEARP